MPRKSSENRGPAKYQHLPARERSATSAGALPSLADASRWVDLCDLCLRDGYYLAICRSSDGGVVLIQFMDGSDRRRYAAHTRDELSGIVDALYEEFWH
jgi:hypothetical protein